MEALADQIVRSVSGTVTKILGVVAEHVDTLADLAAAAANADSTVVAEAYARGSEDAYRAVARAIRAVIDGAPATGAPA